MNKQTLLLSIHDVFADSIFSGLKLFELRRVRPSVGPGDRAVVYVPTPTRAIVGTFEVGRVLSQTPGGLWKSVGADSGISKRAFESYFEGASLAFAIETVNPKRFTSELSLEEIRLTLRSFSPPQSYHFLRSTRVSDRRLLQLIDRAASRRTARVMAMCG